jgi:hypothetical protein
MAPHSADRLEACNAQRHSRTYVTGLPKKEFCSAGQQEINRRHREQLSFGVPRHRIHVKVTDC